ASVWQVGDKSGFELGSPAAPAVLVVAHTVILYSLSPSDTVAMIAHLGKFVGEALLLFCLIQMGVANTARRRQAEQLLLELNRERTTRLREINERMHLLEQIT